MSELNKDFLVTWSDGMNDGIEEGFMKEDLEVFPGESYLIKIMKCYESWNRNRHIDQVRIVTQVEEQLGEHKIIYSVTKNMGDAVK